MYAKRTGNEIYSDVADSLLDEIFEGISKDETIDFADGLTGIAWGIEYLIQNNLVDGDSNEVCSEIDRAIAYKFLEDDDDSTIINGEDLLKYTLARIKGSFKQHSAVCLDAQFMQKLHALSCNILSDNRATGKELASMFVEYYTSKQTIDYDLNIENFIEIKTKITEKTFLNKGIGISNGLAGWLWLQN